MDWGHIVKVGDNYKSREVEWVGGEVEINAIERKTKSLNKSDSKWVP